MSGLLHGAFASRTVRCSGTRPVSSAFLQGAQLQCRVSRQGRGTRKVTVMKDAAYDPIATPYAYALVDLATEKKVLNEIHADIDTLRTLFEEDKGFRDFMYNPVAGNDKKRAIISKIQKDAGLQSYTANFLNLILDRGRVEALENIFEAFEAEYCKRTDTQVAVLRSAVKLEEEQQFLIAKKLQEMLSVKNIKIKPVIDPELIAGFVVQYSSAQIDLSVKGKLDRLSMEMQGV